MTRLISRWLALVLLLALVAVAQATTRWDAPVAAFAKKIIALTGPGAATLEVQNISSFPPDQVVVVRRLLEAQLRAEGVQIRPGSQAPLQIQVTFSESPHGWVWIAQVQQGTATRLTMYEVPDTRTQTAAASDLPLTLRSTPLLSTQHPLLDVQPLRMPEGTLAALTTQSVMLYQQQDGKWQLVRQLPIPLQLRWPRDPRGRIVPAPDHPFDLYMPGGNCAAVADGTKVLLNCLATDAPWPLEGQKAYFNADRNYFTGVLVPGIGRDQVPFFSAATIPQTSDPLWVFARIDGVVSIYDGHDEQSLNGVARSWGSDIVALRSNCSDGTVVVSERIPHTQTDSLRAFAIAEREAKPASAPLKFSGRITALWPNPGASSATAIMQAAPGVYQAYSISLGCRQ